MLFSMDSMLFGRTSASATALQLQCGYSIASHRGKTIKSEMLTTQSDMNCKWESSPTERRLLTASRMSSVHLWRDGSRRRRGSYVLQKRRSQGASVTWFDVAECLQAKLSPAANLLMDLTLRSS